MVSSLLLPTIGILLVRLFLSAQFIFTVFGMHFLIFLNCALLLVAFAAAVPQNTTTCTEEPAATTSSAAISSPSIPYGIISARSGSPIHLLPMQARNQNFYLGGLPGAYCPQPPVSSCPSGVATIFVGLGGLVSLCSHVAPQYLIVCRTHSSQVVKPSTSAAMAVLVLHKLTQQATLQEPLLVVTSPTPKPTERNLDR